MNYTNRLNRIPGSQYTIIYRCCARESSSNERDIVNWKQQKKPIFNFTLIG